MEIRINTQSSIKFSFDKIIYFDPYKINEKYNDADIIFITHDHYDHYDLESINNVIKDKKLREIADEFNISQSRISRIIQSGLDRIKKELVKQGII